MSNDNSNKCPKKNLVLVTMFAFTDQDPEEFKAYVQEGLDASFPEGNEEMTFVQIQDFTGRREDMEKIWEQTPFAEKNNTKRDVQARSTPFKASAFTQQMSVSGKKNSMMN